MRDLAVKFASRKLLAFLLTVGVLAALAWHGKAGVDGWVIAAVFGAYAGAQGLVDKAASAVQK